MFFPICKRKKFKLFQLLKNVDIYSKKYNWGLETVGSVDNRQQYIFFTICKRKEFEFQLLENFKKNVLMHRPVAKDCPWIDAH